MYQKNTESDIHFFLPFVLTSFITKCLLRLLQPEKLCKRLGDDFDSFWMSVDLPEDYLETHIKHKVDTSLKEQLNMVNFTALEDALYHRYDKTEGGNKTKAVLDLVKDWMVQKSSCPVYYRWEDLGFFYWPRWVRRGMCSLKDTPLLNTDMSSKAAQHFPCSWPPGMHCVPGRPKQLNILTLQCRRRKGINHFHRYEMPRRGNSPSHSPNVSENRLLPSHSYQVVHADLGWDANRTIRDAPYTKPVLDIENKLDNRKRVSARRGKGLKKCKESIKSKTEKIREESGTTSSKRKVDSLLQRKPQGKHTTRKGTRKDDDNDTGNWRSASWEAGRQGSNLRCKWIKIPYPVTDDCFCSC